jgi:pyrroline-5-carboxylate reductase
MTDYSIAFVGAGNMASSLIRGLLQRGFSPGRIAAADPSSTCRDALAATGIALAEDNEAVLADADVVVLAVKPQVMPQLLPALAPVLARRKPLLISIAAGIRCDSLRRWAGSALPIVRCMPNTPALVGAGATGLYASADVSELQRQRAGEILGAVGINTWVDNEDLLDAVTAVSGSGPAYFFLFMEAMIDAGTRLGLTPEQASLLVRQTALGASRMALEGADGVAELRRKVTSPGGTTERAVQAFEAGNFRHLVERAMVACAERSVQLAQELGSAP